MFKRVPVLLVGLLATVLWVDVASPHQAQGAPPDLPPAPPARKIPGITIKDEKPHACVDCHRYDAEMKMDSRFSTWLKDWEEKAPKELVEKTKEAAPKGMKIKGRHPKVKADLTTAKIPGVCMECHAERPKNKKEAGPPFSRLLHRIHLVGGEKNHFLTYYQGECTYCHKLDKETGAWSVGSGTEQLHPGPGEPQKEK